MSKSQTTSPGTRTGINLAMGPRFLTEAFLPDADCAAHLR
jgi:hypothetical protein